MGSCLQRFRLAGLYLRWGWVYSCAMVVGVALGLAICAVATLVGGRIAAKFTQNLLEQLAFGGALALGILAYWMAGFAAVGLASRTGALLGLIATLGTLWGLNWLLRGRPLSWHEACPHFRTPFELLLITMAWLLALLSLALCMLPPDGNEWDALAYHLAFPKLYLQAGRMVEIPFMHQSYFPPLQDMLYLLGLALGSESAAKVMHWAMGTLTVLGAAGFVQRHGGSGAYAAVLVLGVPAFLWQMFSAYADLATALYTSLALFGLAHAIRERASWWVWLAGVMMGFALATKYTALLAWGLWGLIGIGWLWHERAMPLARTLALSGLLAVALGSPWYLRNWMWTGNPVYPFAYALFGGKNWSQEQAEAYRHDQLKFGMGREPAMLVLAPWHLAATPAPFADPIGAAVGERVFLLPTLGAGVLALPSLWLAGGTAPAMGYLLSFAALNFVGWFYLMQQIRYLLLVVPVLGGAGLVGMANASAWARYSFGAVLLLQAGFTLWLMSSVYLTQVPLALRDREAYLMRRLQTYPAIQFLNAQPDPHAGVILLDETRGYYLNRPYLWGNAGHHRLIPYESMRSGAALTQWMRQHGYRYVLINRRFTPAGAPEAWRALYYDAIAQGWLTLVYAERGVEVYQLVE